MLVAQSCLTPCNLMDCVARQALLSMGFCRQEYWSGLPFISSSRGSSQPRDQNQVSCIADRNWVIKQMWVCKLKLLFAQKGKKKKVTDSLVKEPVIWWHFFNNPFRNKNYKSSLIRGHWIFFFILFSNETFI